MPVCALTTTSAVSTAASARSPAREIGIARRIGQMHATPPHSKPTRALFSEWPSSFSSGSASQTVLPLLDAALALMAPVAASKVLGERGLAGSAVADEGDGADVVRAQA